MFKSEGKGRALYQKLEYILPTFLVESNLVEGGHSREGGAAKLNLGWEVTHLDLKEQPFYEIDGLSFCILKHVQSLVCPGQLSDNTVESIENKFGTNSEFLALVGWLVDVEQSGESLFWILPALDIYQAQILCIWHKFCILSFCLLNSVEQFAEFQYLFLRQILYSFTFTLQAVIK